MRVNEENYTKTISEIAKIGEKLYSIRRDSLRTAIVQSIEDCATPSDAAREIVYYYGNGEQL